MIFLASVVIEAYPPSLMSFDASRPSTSRRKVWVLLKASGVVSRTPVQANLLYTPPSLAFRGISAVR